MALLILLIVAIVGCISLAQTKTSVQSLDATLGEVNGVLTDLGVQLGQLNAKLAPVEELDTMATLLDTMDEELGRLTSTICGSNLFLRSAEAAGCSARPGYASRPWTGTATPSRKRRTNFWPPASSMRSIIWTASCLWTTCPG